MIQTKIPINYWRRDNKKDIVKIEIRPAEETEDGQWFLVIDRLLSNDKDAFFSKKVFKTNNEIDQIEAYIQANYDLSGLTRNQREFKKLQIALMLDTTTNLLDDGLTTYQQNPNIWEFTPEL